MFVTLVLIPHPSPPQLAFCEGKWRLGMEFVNRSSFIPTPTRNGYAVGIPAC
jgi:hypothetical protein